MYRTDDPIADFKRQDALQHQAEKALPKCAECDKPIFDSLCYEVNDEPVCDDCMHDNHRKSIEYFM